MTNSDMSAIEQKNQTDISNTVDQVAASSSKNFVVLKVFEYLALAGFICTGILNFVLEGDQNVKILTVAFLSIFIFFFLIDKQFGQSYSDVANQFDLGKKAELYSYLLTDNNPSQKNLIAPARQKALQYSQDLIDDYKRTRENSRNIYYVFQMATIILSGVTPILVLVDKLEAGQTWLKWLPVICPAIASIVASIVTSFPFQENWISANTAVELLEAEQEKFILGVTPAYRCYDVAEETERQQKAKTAIENFINQVNTIHLKQIQQSSDKSLTEDKTQPVQSPESIQTNS